MLVDAKYQPVSFFDAGDTGLQVGKYALKEQKPLPVAPIVIGDVKLEQTVPFCSTCTRMGIDCHGMVLYRASGSLYSSATFSDGSKPNGDNPCTQVQTVSLHTVR